LLLLLLLFVAAAGANQILLLMLCTGKLSGLVVLYAQRAWCGACALAGTPYPQPSSTAQRVCTLPLVLLLNVLLDTLGAPAVAFAWMLHLSTCCAWYLLLPADGKPVAGHQPGPAISEAMPPHPAAVAACTPAAAAAAALAVLDNCATRSGSSTSKSSVSRSKSRAAHLCSADAALQLSKTCRAQRSSLEDQP